MAAQVPFSKLIATATASAVHLEMRDWYAVTEERDEFVRWRAGKLCEDAERERRRNWLDLMRSTTSRGVTVRRARIVSEPVTEYIRFEWAGTPLNIEAGERVRWLPRRRASDLCLPGNDFWVFDDRLVRFGYFTGDGEFIDDELWEDPAVVELCALAFEAVWKRGIDHAEYRPT